MVRLLAELRLFNLICQVITDVPPTGTTSRHGRSGYSMADRSGSAHRSNGTIPRNGFTIELEPETYNDTGELLFSFL